MDNASSRGRRALRTGAAGLVVIVLGLVWDQFWHRANGDAELGSLTRTFAAHWLIFAGVLTVFGGTVVAAAALAAPRAALAGRVAALAASSMLIGLAIDTVQHYRRVEMGVWHTLAYGGLLVSVIAVIAALVANRQPVREHQPQ